MGLFSEDGVYHTSNTGENMAQFTKDGSAALFYDGSTKVETSSTGVTVTGTLTATTFSGSGADLTSVPFPAVGGVFTGGVYFQEDAVFQNTSNVRNTLCFQ